MKKAIFLFLFFSLFVAAVFTQEDSSQEKYEKEISVKENPQKTSGWNFYIEPVFGLRVGKENEIVWEKNSKNNETYKLSELEWKYTPSFYLGTNLLLGYKRLEISLLTKFFLPTSCGIMTDSDWQQDAGYKTGNTSIKTNYSESDNKIQSGQDLELAFAIKMYPTHFLTLKPKLSVNYQHTKFEGIGGKYWYGKPLPGKNVSYYSYDSEKISTGNWGNNTVIKYETHNLYLWTGIQADFIPTKKLVLSIATEAAPLVYVFSYDNHVLTNVDFKQYSLSLFYAVRQSLTATYIFNNNFSLSFNFAAVITGETMGPSFQKRSTEKTYKRDGDAGNSTRYLDFGLSAKISW